MDSLTSGKLAEISGLFKTLCDQVDSVLGPDMHLVDGEDVCVPQLQLSVPGPAHLVPQLMAVGAPKKLAAEVASVHSTRARDLASQYLDIYKKTATEIARICRPPHHQRRDALFSRLQKLPNIYEEMLKKWEDEYVGLVKEWYPLKRERGSVPKDAFRKEFTPYLEIYFNQNMYPSPADKRSLAQTSGMTVEQIHIWFQNHRRRAKNGQFATKGSPSQTSASSSRVTRPEQHEDDGDVTDVAFEEHSWSRSSSLTLVDDSDPFVRESPTYAYPSPYPPDKKCYPFSVVDGILVCQFPAPTWKRTPVSVLPAYAEPDVDSLVSAFGALRIGSVQPKSRPVATLWGLHKPAKKSGHDVTSFYTSRPPRAPLPSLVSDHQIHAPILNSLSTVNNILGLATSAPPMKVIRKPRRANRKGLSRDPLQCERECRVLGGDASDHKARRRKMAQDCTQPVTPVGRPVVGDWRRFGARPDSTVGHAQRTVRSPSALIRPGKGNLMAVPPNSSADMTSRFPPHAFPTMPDFSFFDKGFHILTGDLVLVP